MKTCTGCKQDKPIDEFSPHKLTRDGRRPRCRECSRADKRVRRATDPEYADRQRDSVRRHREANREGINERARLKRADDPEYADRQRDSVRRHREANREGINERARLKYAADSEYADRRRAKTRAYDAANPEKARAREDRRRAREHGAFVEDVHTDEVLERHGRWCYLCETQISGEVHVDHVEPLSRGGEHSYDNTRPTHPECNWTKATKFLHELDLPFTPPYLKSGATSQ